MSSVCALKISESTCRRLSSWSSRRIGFSITSWRACSGVSSSRFRSEPTSDADAHHDRLAGRIDRRVRHLREELLEVGVEERAPVRECRERRVVAHRADRLLGVDAREARASPSCLLACSRRRAAADEAAPRDGSSAGRGGRSARLHDAPARTSRHTAAASRSAASARRRARSPCSRSTRKSLPGCSRPLRRTFSGGDVEYAGFGGEHDPPVACLEPAAGPKAVAVEHRPDHAARR